MSLNYQNLNLNELKVIAHQELSSCCMSFCYKPAVFEYIKKLENEIERLENDKKC